MRVFEWISDIFTSRIDLACQCSVARTWDAWSVPRDPRGHVHNTQKLEDNWTSIFDMSTMNNSENVQTTRADLMPPHFIHLDRIVQASSVIDVKDVCPWSPAFTERVCTGVCVPCYWRLLPWAMHKNQQQHAFKIHSSVENPRQHRSTVASRHGMTWGSPVRQLSTPCPRATKTVLEILGLLVRKERGGRFALMRQADSSLTSVPSRA